ncbi:hypothetical protein [Alienimonas californiensis]|uniref:Uncharacterized protein n=1 Tax=Alienimonas californiensis TaxID=2527989 RepID=A0A517PBL3_9PLAN|nr:hypothetical protein [Alienimonas californiensis]QDT16760.1 hypothetical protein CA12_28670 [Alienimonas californiensis]
MSDTPAVPPAEKDRVPLPELRRQLLIVWFGGAGTLFVLLLVLSMGTRFQPKMDGERVDQREKVWAWYVGAIGPTLGLMLGVLGKAALDTEPDERTVDRFYARFAVGLSAFYLLMAAISVLGAILLPQDGGPTAAEAIPVSNLWLGILQGLAVAAIGFLFTAQDRKKAASAANESSIS